MRVIKREPSSFCVCSRVCVQLVAKHVHEAVSHLPGVGADTTHQSTFTVSVLSLFNPSLFHSLYFKISSLLLTQRSLAFLQPPLPLIFSLFSSLNRRSGVKLANVHDDRKMEPDRERRN